MTLTTIASLSLLAGVIIIANAVALAMLERRRELGILKSIGHSSRSLLSEVLLENGIVGVTGALIAMLLVTLVTSFLGQLVFDCGRCNCLRRRNRFNTSEYPYQCPPARDKSFNVGPVGRFSPRSHWLTTSFDTFR